MTQIKAVSTLKCIWKAACHLSQHCISSGKHFLPFHFRFSWFFDENKRFYYAQINCHGFGKVLVNKINVHYTDYTLAQNLTNVPILHIYPPSSTTRIGRKGPFRMRALWTIETYQKLFQAVWKCHIHKKVDKITKSATPDLSLKYFCERNRKSFLVENTESAKNENNNKSQLLFKAEKQYNNKNWIEFVI